MSTVDTTRRFSIATVLFCTTWVAIITAGCVRSIPGDACLSFLILLFVGQCASGYARSAIFCLVTFFVGGGLVGSYTQSHSGHDRHDEFVLRDAQDALNQYVDTHGELPAAIVEGSGGHKHSWRLELLPMLGHQAEYQAYRRDQPWDSPSNSAIAAKVNCFTMRKTPPGTTTLLAVTGPGTVFANEPRKPSKSAAVYSVIVVQSKNAVPWNKPEDLDLRESKTWPPIQRDSYILIMNAFDRIDRDLFDEREVPGDLTKARRSVRSWNRD